MPRAAQNQTSSRLLHRDGEFFDGAEPGAVERGHVAQLEDDDFREVVQMIVDGLQRVGGAEQERTVDPEDLDVAWNKRGLQAVDVPFADVFVGHRRIAI